MALTPCLPLAPPPRIPTPPLSSPFYSPNLTHLTLEVAYYDPHPAIPTVDEMLSLISSMPNLEQLRLGNIPVPDRVQPSGPGLTEHRSSVLLPSSLRNFEYDLTEYNGSIPASLEFLSRLVLPRGVRMKVEICQDKDKDVENVVFARVTSALFRAINKPAGVPWKLGVGDHSADIFLDADAREKRMDPMRYLHRQIVDGDTYISHYRNGGMGDVDASAILHGLPLADLVSLEIYSFNSESSSPGSGSWIRMLQSALAVRNLGITLPISLDIFGELGHVHRINSHADKMIFPHLESITLRWIPREEREGQQEAALGPLLDAIAAFVTTRLEELSPLRLLFVDKRLEDVFPRRQFAGIDVTFFDISTTYI